MLSAFTIAGLAVALLGSALLATNALLSRHRAAESVFAVIAPARGDPGYGLPVVRQELSERRRTQFGFAVLAAGTALQLIGAIPAQENPPPASVLHLRCAGLREVPWISAGTGPRLCVPRPVPPGPRPPGGTLVMERRRAPGLHPCPHTCASAPYMFIPET